MRVARRDAETSGRHWAHRLLTGWGRSTASLAWVAGPLPTERLRELVLGHPAGGVVARGAGLSYGDAAQNAGGYVLSPVSKPQIELSADAATVRATASVSFAGPGFPAGSAQQHSLAVRGRLAGQHRVRSITGPRHPRRRRSPTRPAAGLGGIRPRLPTRPGPPSPRHAVLSRDPLVC